MNERNWKLIKNVTKNVASIWLIFIIFYYGRYVVMNGVSGALDDLELSSGWLLVTMIALTIEVFSYPIKTFLMNVKRFMANRKGTTKKNTVNKNARKRVNNK